MPLFGLRRLLTMLGALIAFGAGAVLAQEPAAYVERLPKGLGRVSMAPIPAGKVTLDDPANPGTPVEVEVKPFFMSKSEIRWDEFAAYMYRLDLTDAQAAAGFDAENRPSMPYIPPDQGFGTDGMPVIAVSYLNASKFCEWLSKLTDKTYRLPTEAEWVWAALDGAVDQASAATCQAIDPTQLDKVAWFGKTMANPNKQPAQAGTMPVAEKEANGYGLYDVFGNVREWVTGLDGKPVTKGGGWVDDADQLTPFARILPTLDWQKTDPQNPKSKWWLSDGPWVGLRVVCEQ